MSFFTIATTVSGIVAPSVLLATFWSGMRGLEKSAAEHRAFRAMTAIDGPYPFHTPAHITEVRINGERIGHEAIFVGKQEGLFVWSTVAPVEATSTLEWEGHRWTYVLGCGEQMGQRPGVSDVEMGS